MNFPKWSRGLARRASTVREGRGTAERKGFPDGMEPRRAETPDVAFASGCDGGSVHKQTGRALRGSPVNILCDILNQKLLHAVILRAMVAL
jgi:hypothetical protein